MVVASPNSIQTEKIVSINLPTIDLSKERATVAKLIVKASEEYGFFNVINHRIPQHIIDNMEEAGFDFFAKPASQKAKLASNYDSVRLGYGCKNIGFNGDVGEVEYLLLNGSASHISKISTTISNDPSNFRYRVVSAYRDAVEELACEILELMAEGLGVPNTSIFTTFINHPDSDSLLRFNHYPPLPPSLAFGDHSDPQIITLLRSNPVSGLQISLQHGLWIPVLPDPKAFSVNVGDLLQVMTNGRFVSVRHRAVTNSEKARMSIAYFGAPPLNACIVAPPEMVTPERPSLLFRAFTWAEYKKATYSLRLGDTRIDLFRN
ncbi:gibberellin 2-beta-dioxygenase 2 [Arachis duranensis]|uniref:gibberellin 2beta-dioxygenase n=1 Tax=Arachis duranensis TaxID=130453 RepID=A0A6P4D0H5_ARADU|nr:gibberellin 2-beta-dioxygenase 2 [Arachis duranensis]XP_025694464.1 gibberellin 2-beta-dioxygenase 2 [Arachis hypogaea]